MSSRPATMLSTDPHNFAQQHAQAERLRQQAWDCLWSRTQVWLRSALALLLQSQPRTKCSGTGIGLRTATRGSRGRAAA